MRKDIGVYGFLLAGMLLAVCLLLPSAARADEEALLVEGGSLAEAAANDPDARTFMITGQVATGGYTVNGGVTVIVSSGGSLSGKLYMNGGTVTGGGDMRGVIRYVRIPANVTKIAGTVDEENNRGWMTEDQTLYVLLNNELYFYRLTGGQLEGPLSNAITYVDAQGTRLSLDGLPSSYFVMDVDQTIPEGPEINGTAFGKWSGDLGEGRTVRIPAGTNQGITLVWNPVYGQQEVPSGGASADGTSGSGASSGSGIPAGGGGFSGGGGGFSGRGGGSFGGGSGAGTDSGDAPASDGGAASAKAAPSSSGTAAAASADSAGGSAATLSNVYTSGTSAVRARRVSSNTRRVITDDGGYAEAKIAAAGKEKDAFPWEKAALIAGGSLMFLLVVLLSGRRAKAKRKAMYEKLRIRED